MKRRWAIAALLAGMTGALVAPAMTPDEQMRLADGLYTRGMYAMAVREYLVLLEKAPDHPAAAAAYFCIADSYRALSNRVAALRYFAETEKRFPGSTDSYRAIVKRAEMLDEDHNTVEAIALLRAVIAAKPPAELAAAALYKLGGLLAKTGQPAEAREAYGKLVAEFPSTPFHPYAALTLAGLYAAMPDGAARALELFQVATTAKGVPRINAEAWFQLGDYHYREKKYSNSAEAFGKLASLFPDDQRTPEARLPWAWSLFYAGMAADALKHADAALVSPTATANPAQREEWLYLKANCQRQIIDHVGASITYSNLLERFPQGHYAASAAYERALALHRAGDARSAIVQARALLTPANTNRADVYWLLAESHYALQEEEQAVQYYRLLSEQHPDAPLAIEAGYRLARLLQKRNELLPAAELFGKLADKRPDHPLAPQSLFAGAVCLSKLSRHEEAVREWGMLVQKYPTNNLVEDALFQKAMGEIFLHRDPQAIVSMRDLLARFPASRHGAETRFWLGMLLDAAGQSRDAENELRQALKLSPVPDLERRVRFQLALVLQRLGTHEEAATLLKDLLGTPISERMTPSLLEWLAEYYLERKIPIRAEEAARIIVAQVASNSWRQVGYCLTGKALQLQGRSVEAMDAFSKALAIEGVSEARAESALRLGGMNLATNGYAAARAYFEQAAELARDDALIPIRARAYAGIGKALKAQGDSEGAVKYFMSVALLFEDPTLVPECMGEAAILFQQLGRKEESDKVWQELAQRYPQSQQNTLQPR